MTKMTKLCVIYNMAAKYRAPIFKLLDKNFEIDWFYGHQIGDIKEMDSSDLKRVSRLERFSLGPFTWQKKAINLLNCKSYDKYIILGDFFYLSTWGILLLNKLRKHPKKIYLWSHGWYGRESSIKKLLKKIFFGLSDGVFLYGNYAKKIAEIQGNDTSKLLVIHNSLDYEYHCQIRNTLGKNNVFADYFQNSNPTLIFIGRLTKVKQLHLLIDALNILNKNNHQYNLVFVGDGEERTELEKQANTLNLPVWFYGSCYDDKESSSLIYNADLCVSPGNVGLTSIHSMSFGTPVLSHSNFKNQMPEFEAIIPGKTGDFFQEGDSQSIANCILKWFSSHPDRERVRKDCFAEIEKSWTPKYQLDQIQSVIND